jgi:hypothetical protein
MSSIAVNNPQTTIEKPVNTNKGENFSLNFEKPDNSLAYTDSFKSSEKYTVGQGFAAAAKIGIGVAAADLATQQIYPGQHDKRLHSLAGGLISGVSGEVTTAITHNKLVGILVGIGAGVLAGAAKEIWDAQGHGDPDKHDFFATSLGASTVGLSLTLPF